MLGGFLSAGFIFMIEFRDDSIKSVDQLRTVYLPALTLSVIPTFKKENGRKKKSESSVISDELIILKNRFSPAAESFSRLKNNIIYQHGNYPPKTIAVTSAEKGDGKSTIISNLGITLAQEGFKTLVLDTDLRQPKIHTYYNLNSSPGLTDYLFYDAPIQDTIQNTDIRSLKVVTAGSKINNPDIIAGSQSFKSFLNNLESVFDVILMDTPPFGIISDSTPLLKTAEATIVVAKHRKTNKGMLLKTVEDLGRIQANVTTVVLNAFDHRKETGSYYGDNYYQTLYSNYKSYVN